MKLNKKLGLLFQSINRLIESVSETNAMCDYYNPWTLKRTWVHGATVVLFF